MKEIEFLIPILLFIVFYYFPVFEFLRIKFKTIMIVPALLSFSLFVKYVFVNYIPTPINSEIIFMTLVSTLILAFMFQKSLPYDLSSNTYNFNLNKFSNMFLFLVLTKYAIFYISYFLVIILSFFGINESTEQMSSGSNQDATIFITFLTACIIAPVTEEYALRYFLYGYVLKHKLKINIFISAIISSFMFAILHDGLFTVVHAFVAGLFLTYIYQKYGLWYSIITHFIFNALVVVAMII